MPTIDSQPPSPADRPSNREVEQENQRTDSPEGQPPRPATEPPGAAGSSQSPKTETDPGTGES
ncbi:MAG: hypothetical protein DI526_13330 [Caulobacter segnis]|uniref:Uncharacterized protein n=1 Tax=Caulobacter segnis TaxID=88688 RepID=A0A2W5V6S0_9CAUL|nr:MAG: hypothetical protein DI526_13330 [Caulobacter segnis]